MAIGSVKLVQNILFGTGGTQDTGAKFYITTFEKGSANASKLYKVPYSTTVTTAVGGVYETQTQMWQKKIKVAQARFYVESTVANNSFQMDLIDSKGNVISGSTFTYTFTTSQDMIQFNPAMTGEYGLALRITNLGSANMTFKKVELDLVEWGI